MLDRSHKNPKVFNEAGELRYSWGPSVNMTKRIHSKKSLEKERLVQQRLQLAWAVRMRQKYNLNVGRSIYVLKLKLRVDFQRINVEA